jgi:hypothetical protein
MGQTANSADDSRRTGSALVGGQGRAVHKVNVEKLNELLVEDALQ